MIETMAENGTLMREGAITPSGLVDTFRKIVCSHKTCMLFLQKEEVYKAVYFEEGNIVHAESNQKDETLSYRLLDRSLVDLETLAEAMKHVQPDRNLGKILIEKGVIEEQSLGEIMKSLIADIVIQIFDWQSGSFMLQEVGALYGKELVHGLSTIGIVLEGVRRMYDFEDIMGSLLAIDAPLQFSEDPFVGKQQLLLEPAEGFILSRVDGYSRVRDICSVSMLSEEMTCRVIYGLICGGLLKLAEPEKKAATVVASGTYRVEKVSPEEIEAREKLRDSAQRSRKRPAASKASDSDPQAPPVQVVVEQQAQAAVPPSTADASKPSKAQAGAKAGEKPAEADEPDYSGYNADQRATIKQLESLYEIIDQTNHYSILGIPKDAPASLVNQAFERLSERYHPSHSQWMADPVLQSKLAYVFAKMSKAQATLTDDTNRIEYDEKLRRQERTTMSSELKIRREFLKTDRQVEIAQSEQEADEFYRKSKEQFNQQRYHDAMEACRKALKLCPDVAKYHAFLGKILMKNPKMRWQKEAENHLQRAMELNQWTADYPFALASLYKNAGLGIKAQKLFIKTLELDPLHAGALDEVPPELRPQPKIRELMPEDDEDDDVEEFE